MELLKNANATVIGLWAISVLIVVRISLRQGADLDQQLGRLMNQMVGMTIVAILVNTACWLFDGVSGSTARTLIWLVNSVSFLTAPWTPLLWYRVTIYLAAEELSSRLVAVTIAVYGALVVLVIGNPAWRLLFTVDAANVHRAGPLAMVVYVLPYSFLFLSMACMYHHRNEYSFEVMAAQHFWLPPLAAGALQLCFPEINLVIPSMALCILSLYSGLQARSARLDYLTGIHTRSYLDQFLRRKLRSEAFGAIMADIDHFKLINDRYGHVVGDEVLIGVASAFKLSARQTDCVARFGGDEFVVILDSAQPEVLTTVLHRLDLLLTQLNEASSYPFVISLSIGSDILHSTGIGGAQQLIRHIDRLMYADKSAKGTELVMKESVGSVAE